MRIPSYNSQLGVNVNQLATPRVSKIDIGPVVDAVERAYDVNQSRKEEARRLFISAETQRAEADVFQKYTDILSNIENGGEYANAEKQFQDYFNKQTNTSLSKFGDDAVAAKIRLQYEKSGTEYGLRVRDAVQKRLRSDAQDAFKVRMSNIEFKLSNAASDTESRAMLSDASDVLASAEESGIIPRGQGEVYLRKVVNTYVDDMIDRSPSEFLSKYNKNPDMFSGVSSLNKKVEFAKRKQEKIQRTAELNRISDDVRRDVDLHNRAMSGQLEAADFENEDNPIIKTASADKPVSAPADSQQRLLDLKREVSALSSQYKVRKTTSGKYGLRANQEFMTTEEGYKAVLNNIEEYRNKVRAAYEDGIFTGRNKGSYMTLMSELDETLNGYVAKLKSEDEPSWFDYLTKKPSEYSKYAVTDMVEKFVGGAPLSEGDSFDAKVILRDSINARLEELDKSKNPNEVLSKIASEEFNKLMVGSYPGLRLSPYAATAQRVLTNDGGDYTKPDSKINVDSKALSDVDTMSEAEIDAMLKAMRQ